jgi:DNA-binding transcriptional ArsR family regulator
LGPHLGPSDRALDLLDAVRDGLRLRILLALEQKPSSVTELARLLSVPHGKVNWAVKSLMEAGIVEVQSSRSEAKTISILLTTRHAGWSGLAAVLDGIAGTADRA